MSYKVVVNAEHKAGYDDLVYWWHCPFCLAKSDDGHPSLRNLEMEFVLLQAYTHLIVVHKVMMECVELDRENVILDHRREDGASPTR